MNWLFESKYIYQSHQDLYEVKNVFHSFSADKWYDIRNNIVGKITDNAEFIVQSKFSIGMSVFRIPQNTALITGKFHVSGDKTTAEVIVRPSYGIVIAFYFIICLWLMLAIDGMNKHFPELVLTPILLVYIFSHVYVSKRRLKRRFEKTFDLERFEN